MVCFFIHLIQSQNFICAFSLALCNSDLHPDPDPDLDPNHDPESDADPDPDSDPSPDPDSDLDPDPDSYPDLDPDPDPEFLCSFLHVLASGLPAFA